MHDDFAIEPVKGLPGKPPAGEEVLWQGKPHWFALAKDALKLYWFIGYFALLVILRAIALSDQGWDRVLASVSALSILAVVLAAILLLMAWIMASATVYTITSARVAMRIGAALTVTLNLPFTKIASADFNQKSDGTGTIAMTLMGDTKLSYFVCWPHVRPWRMKDPQPCLRSIAEVEQVAAILAAAAERRIEEAVETPQVAPVPAE